MIMTNSSEEIADEIQSEAIEENIPYYADLIEQYADELLFETLQELKEELRSIERGTCMIHLGEAIEKIDGAIND